MLQYPRNLCFKPQGVPLGFLSVISLLILSPATKLPASAYSQSASVLYPPSSMAFLTTYHLERVRLLLSLLKVEFVFSFLILLVAFQRFFHK